jgi:rhodanese-related sulfurtransferase/DNA-binding transcriptional ArsR family regulator
LKHPRNSRPIGNNPPASGRPPHAGSATAAKRPASFDAIQDSLFEQLARIGKAVGNKQRLKLLELLAQTERTVEALAAESGLSVANVSQHLQRLRETGIVEASKTGLYVRYRLAGPEVLELIRIIRRVAETRSAELDRIVRTYLTDQSQLEPVTREELLERMREGSAVVLDVRPVEEFRAGHIAGAISIQLDEIQKKLCEGWSRKEVIAYCRGPYCLLGHRAVELLRNGGRNARRLAEGFPEWMAAGLPVEASTDATAIARTGSIRGAITVANGKRKK